MVALKRALVHSPSSHQMQLSSSTPGEFCIHSLRSSIRELRLATGYVVYIVCQSLTKLTSFRHSVVAFVRPSLQPDIRRANFVIVLEWLKNLSEKDDMPLQEACVITLCRLAKYALGAQHVLSHADCFSFSCAGSRRMRRRISFSCVSWSILVTPIHMFVPWPIMR